MKREDGADVDGERLKRLDANTAPSGESDVVGGSCCAMMELRGSARPRMPSNSYSRGSESTVVAAAACRSLIKGGREQAFIERTRRT